MNDLELRRATPAKPGVVSPLPLARAGARPARTSGNGTGRPLVIESCHSTWVFDEDNHRFRRLLKGARIGRSISTSWRSYHHVVFDDRSDAFLVFLDPCGTRLLRSWRHLGDCGKCGEATAEISAEDVRRLVAV